VKSCRPSWTKRRESEFEERLEQERKLREEQEQRFAE